MNKLMAREGVSGYQARKRTEEDKKRTNGINDRDRTGDKRGKEKDTGRKTGKRRQEEHHGRK